MDKFHKHVCGHGKYGNLKTLLVGNNLWNENVQQYLATVTPDCQHCSSQSLPLPDRRASLSSMNREFNDVWAMDHLHLENVTQFHCMYVASTCSADVLMSSTSLEQSIYAFKLGWISQF